MSPCGDRGSALKRCRSAGACEPGSLPRVRDPRLADVGSADSNQLLVHKLIRTEGAELAASVGSTFSSTGANFNGTFHDRSVISELVRPSRFTIETDSHLERVRGKPWDVHFRHRYDVEAEGSGSRIVYTETIERVNYVPYWLKPGIRTIFRPLVNSADRKQLSNLARLAEERSNA